MQNINADYLALNGWVKSHWRTIAIASLALNVTLLLYLLLK